eukprot:CAMPEP_0183811552 /NCGR_PEP_ID=MMETSP0803_2-20130417/49616_1 /TAXON_ID=195967 /ORGANISM="Crustomastix stigmata, Strain CCMP3273" /LENGTH=293 /DNA_ID=CAMNT_0026056391 /DNA_START=116 /DNA_END=993 /DNA_ORIENTATION=-
MTLHTDWYSSLSGVVAREEERAQPARLAPVAVPRADGHQVQRVPELLAVVLLQLHPALRSLRGLVAAPRVQPLQHEALALALERAHQRLAEPDGVRLTRALAGALQGLELVPERQLDDALLQARQRPAQGLPPLPQAPVHEALAVQLEEVEAEHHHGHLHLRLGHLPPRPGRQLLERAEPPGGPVHGHQLRVQHHLRVGPPPRRRTHGGDDVGERARALLAVAAEHLGAPASQQVQLAPLPVVLALREEGRVAHGLQRGVHALRDPREHGLDGHAGPQDATLRHPGGAPGQQR